MSKFVLSTRIINTPLEMVHNTLSFNHENTQSNSRHTLEQPKLSVFFVRSTKIVAKNTE